MSFQFGDGFDCYATSADAITGYWDSATNIGGWVLVSTGRFAGSQAIHAAANTNMQKTSGVNDALHHIIIAIRQTAAISGTILSLYLQLTDGATAQCSVVFRSDGAILLTLGASTGTVLATYAGALTAANTWYAFEIEVNVSNTNGYMNVRKNGNTVNDFASATNLNTRTTANNYANRLQIGNGTTSVTNQDIDDLYWRSDASSVPWLGDIRCHTRMPASDAAVQFSRTPTGSAVTVTANTSVSDPTATARYTTFVASYTGTVSTIVVNFNGAFTGNCKLAMFADTSGQPAAVLGSATTLVNPTTGPNTFTFSTPIPVVKGVAYWFGISHDVTAVPATTNLSTIGRTSNTVAYASFPAASPTTAATQQQMGSSVNIGPSINAECVGEPQQDAAVSYVYSSTPGHADLYGIAPIASTPLVTHAVTTRAYAIKSDAGTRTMAVQLKSGGTTVASPTVVLTPSNWQWAWRTDTVDPATGSAWTAAAVNVANVGVTVIA